MEKLMWETAAGIAAKTAAVMKVWDNTNKEQLSDMLDSR